MSEIRPGWAVPGGRIAITGEGLPQPGGAPPSVRVGVHEALVVAASRSLIRAVVPADAPGGTMPLRVEGLPGETAYLEVGRTVATSVHHVDSPLFDPAGRLYVTHSGSRGERPATPLFRFDQEGTRTALAVDVGNPTALALGPDGLVYVSSRFDGTIHRLTPDDDAEVFVTGVGVSTGMAFGPEGDLFVGDRSGTVFRVTPARDVSPFVTLPPSMAAYHLAFGPDGALFVAVPTLASHDAIYRISTSGEVEVLTEWFGRPQGLAVDDSGMLYVAEALAGAAGLYRVDPTTPEEEPELVLAAPSLVGVALAPTGGLALASPDTVWRLDVPLSPWTRQPA